MGKESRKGMVSITENAAKAVRGVMEEENLSTEETYLRVAVKGGGCSGLSYELGFDTEKRVGDVVVEKDGVRLIIDLKSQVYLAGTTLDYSSGLSGKGFFFSNPNATGTCGCGKSFSA
jgi:iron-sulfur cluster assembly protein